MNRRPDMISQSLRLQTACCCLLWASLLSGCASWTNPVANGIPVRLLPDELLAESKETYDYVPWDRLQRTTPEEPIIQPEDVLGVYIVGVLGAEDQLPPVQLPSASNVPPALGFPIPVRADGSIPLPLIDDPIIAGLTVEEAEARITEAYTQTNEFLQEDQSIILTMIRPRHVRVLVIRQDALGSRASQFLPTQRGVVASLVTTTASNRQGAGFQLDLPATEADLLTALAQTGGLPGLDAKDEILVYRKSRKHGPAADASDATAGQYSEPRRIPLKIKKGEKLVLTEREISLRDDDIVVIEARDPEHYYTAGLVVNQEIAIPINYDLTVIEAVARVGGPLVNGGFGGANLNGTIVRSGIGNPSPTLLTVLRRHEGQQVPIRIDLAQALRDPRENILIKNNDILLLQETTGESFVRYLSSQFGTSFQGSLFRRRDAAGAASFIFP